MRMTLVLALVLAGLGGLAAYVTGPHGLHAGRHLGDHQTPLQGAVAAGGGGALSVEAPEPATPDDDPHVTLANVPDATTPDVASPEPSRAEQAPPPVGVVAPRSLDLRVILSGHSLTDPMGQALPRLVQAAGGRGGEIALSTIPGAPMDWRWNHRTHPPDAREDIAGFDVMVQTERVSLSGTRRWHNSDDEALRWARHGWEHGAGGQGAEVLLYATWVSLDTGPGFDTHGDDDRNLPWRERLDREFAGWEEIMAHVNANRPDDAPEMRMIPATLVMAAVHDAIEDASAPDGLNDIRQLFTDDIHLSPLGAWLVALTHYAVIYARDPRGLPGPQGDAPSGLTEWVQALVWDVVTGYPGTGVARD